MDRIKPLSVLSACAVLLLFISLGLSTFYDIQWRLQQQAREIEVLRTSLQERLVFESSDIPFSSSHLDRLRVESVLGSLGDGCSLAPPLGEGRVVVPLIFDPTLPSKILEIMKRQAARLSDENPYLRVTVVFDDRPIDLPPSNKTKKAWTKVAYARNRALENIDLSAYDYVAWIDADILEYQPALLTALILHNPSGMSAPLVLVEGGSDFYDFTGFVVDERNPGISMDVEPNYFPDTPFLGRCVELKSVGAFYTVPTDVYRAGVLHDPYEPHFTDHWPIAQWIRAQGRRNVCVTGQRVYHANLPRWGLSWHG